MPSDLIYRKDAKDYVRHAMAKGLNVFEYLDEVPVADFRPVVRGKWVDDNGNPVPWDKLDKNCPHHSAYCSVCGEWLTASDEYPSIGNFCPNCGADMREGKQDE